MLWLRERLPLELGEHEFAPIWHIQTDVLHSGVMGQMLYLVIPHSSHRRLTNAMMWRLTTENRCRLCRRFCLCHVMNLHSLVPLAYDRRRFEF
jgi:hypothetical protein